MRLSDNLKMKKRMRCTLVVFIWISILIYLMNQLGVSYNIDTGVVETEPDLDSVQIRIAELTSAYKTKEPRAKAISTFINKSKMTLCDGQMEIYDETFAVLNDAVVDPVSGNGAKGGEKVDEVLNRPEIDELYKLDKGFFTVRCSGKDILSKSKAITFGRKGHLNDWLNALDAMDEKVGMLRSVPVVKGVTIAIVRYDYANLFWAMMDVFNTFSTAMFLAYDPNDINILFVDGHPSSITDQLWNDLFPRVNRIGHMLKSPVRYERLVWGMMQHASPLLLKYNYRHYLHQVTSFRHFVLSRYGLPISKTLDCKKLKIVVVLRHNYLSHPRNPRKTTKRKIANEGELVARVTSAFNADHVTSVLLEELSMREQIALTSSTDILVGMHGAGLAHVMFLPDHAAVVEMFPALQTTVSHFEILANGRKLTYVYWKNGIDENEVDMYTTIVNTDQIIHVIRNVKRKIC